MIAAMLTAGVAVVLYAAAAWLMPSDTHEAQTGAKPRAVRSSAAVRLLQGTLWLLLALLLLQVYLAGAFLMGGMEAQPVHQGLGYILAYYYPLLVLVAALVAGMPARFWITFGVLYLLLATQPMLTHLSTESGTGWLRAMHPLNGTLILLLTVRLALTARAASRG